MLRSLYNFKGRAILVVSMVIFATVSMAMIAPSTNAQENIEGVIDYLTQSEHHYEFRIDTGRGTPEYAMKVTEIINRDPSSTSFRFRGIYYRGGYGVYPRVKPNVSGEVTVVGRGSGMVTTIRFTTDETVERGVTSFEGAIRFVSSGRYGPSSAFMAGTYRVSKGSSSTSSFGPFPFVARGLAWRDKWLP